MASRALKLYFGGLGVLLLLLAAVAFRPTPFTGLNGDDLARSVNGGILASSAEPCKGIDGGWSCQVFDSQRSGTINYTVSSDWLGCWEARRDPLNGRGATAPPTLSGCVTLLDH